MKKTWILLIGVIVVVAGAIYFERQSADGDQKITTPTNSTTNTQTNTAPITRPTGGMAVRPTKDDLIAVDYPTAETVITSPLTVTGEARGSWYFEASFPVSLYDAEGNIIAGGTAKAQGDWMTTEYVPFTVTLQFSKPATDTGTLVLKKDNPSGDPTKDNSLTIPIRFTPTGEVDSK